MARKLLIGRTPAETYIGCLVMDIAASIPRSTVKRAVLKKAVSWMSLVAATTAGLGPTSTVRARVRADISDELGELRLVIHSYSAERLGSRTVPGAADRPMSSMQRAVTPDELRRGVVVDLVHLAGEWGIGRNPMLVAWVEQGRANLEYDALLARPLPGAPRGCAKAEGRANALCATVELTAG